MNERIRELKEAAMEVTFSSPSTGREQKQLNVDKFAELIVRECIRLCDQVDIVGADECIDNIKEYFGVEE